MRKALVAACAAALLLPSAPAHAAVAAAGPAGFISGFATPVVVVAEGEAITFYSSDIAPHNFIAMEAFLPKKAAKKAKWCSAYVVGRCPLFWSPTIGAGQSTEVLGLERLAPGDQHTFYCSIHPGMQGTLVVR